MNPEQASPNTTPTESQKKLRPGRLGTGLILLLAGVAMIFSVVLTGIGIFVAIIGAFFVVMAFVPSKFGAFPNSRKPKGEGE